MVSSKFCNKIIEFSFIALFLLVPLVFTSKTSEIFEFNKVWLTFGLTIIIASSWIIKSIISKRIFVQKTPLDIPIILFLLSQVISTIISIDPHVSLWGYYSRFNGGLLSIISYIFLYYAFVSNFTGDLAGKMVKKILKISLISGGIVAIWGLPSHFGFDPTCFLLRGSLDVSCWTADFQPKIRIFSTLGQPDWLGAYLAILSPLVLALFLNSKRKLYAICYLLLTVLFYIDIIFTKSRSAFLAFWISIFFFSLAFGYIEKVSLSKKILKEKIIRIFLGIFAGLLIITFFTGQPFTQFDKFTFAGIQNSLKNTNPAKTPNVTPQKELGGTDSGTIRTLVWQGAINTWLKNPIIGTGVETFAYSYYKYKPVAHNLTSEWNFLYNKAHNEYLNYLSTTGALGLLTYISIIVVFLLRIFNELKNRQSSIVNRQSKLLTLSLIAGFLSILVTNFFGFSIAITNIYLFLIPIFVFIPLNLINKKDFLAFPKKESKTLGQKISIFQKADILACILVTIFLLFNLLNFWVADIAFAYGQGLDQGGEYQKANSYLRTAVERVSFEPVFKDALALDDAMLSVSLIEARTKEDKNIDQLIQGLAGEAILYSNEITKDYPNNIIFLKSRVKIFYALSQVDPSYLSYALDAMKKAAILAPNDANVSYNLALLYGQTGDNKKAIENLEKTIKLKADYTTAYYALGVFYHQEAVNKDGVVINDDLNQKAILQMEFILKNIDSKNIEAKEALSLWGRQ